MNDLPASSLTVSRRFGAEKGLCSMGIGESVISSYRSVTDMGGGVLQYSDAILARDFGPFTAGLPVEHVTIDCDACEITVEFGDVIHKEPFALKILSKNVA